MKHIGETKQQKQVGDMNNMKQAPENVAAPIEAAAASSSRWPSTVAQIQSNLTFPSLPASPKTHRPTQPFRRCPHTNPSGET